MSAFLISCNCLTLNRNIIVQRWYNLWHMLHKPTVLRFISLQTPKLQVVKTKYHQLQYLYVWYLSKWKLFSVSFSPRPFKFKRTAFRQMYNFQTYVLEELDRYYQRPLSSTQYNRSKNPSQKLKTQLLRLPCNSHLTSANYLCSLHVSLHVRSWVYLFWANVPRDTIAKGHQTMIRFQTIRRYNDIMTPSICSPQFQPAVMSTALNDHIYSQYRNSQPRNSRATVRN